MGQVDAEAIIRQSFQDASIGGTDAIEQVPQTTEMGVPSQLPNVVQPAVFDPVAEYKRLTEMRSGGRYVPPARLRALQAQIEVSRNSKEYQRLQWGELKKTINGLVNKVNKTNIKGIVVEVFGHNIVRGRGVFARSLMRAQAAARVYTGVYAAVVAVVNSKLPEVGSLVVRRLVIQFRRAFKRGDRDTCVTAAMFLAHLCNQRVVHEILCLEILHLLLRKPSDDNVEIAVALTREVGAFLQEVSPSGLASVFEQFHKVLLDGSLQARTQYMVETILQVRRDDFKRNPAIDPALDLVEEEDQDTHMISLNDEIQAEEGLNVFRFDADYEQNEKEYEQVKHELFGGEDDDEEDEEEDEEADEHDQEKELQVTTAVNDSISAGYTPTGPIIDMTGQELTSLRKRVYLTVMSSMSVAETCHKIMLISVPPGCELEIANMIVECCAQEKIYNKLYGHLVDRLCKTTRAWEDLFKTSFRHYYSVVHRYDSNKLRNIAIMFGQALAMDGLGWDVLDVVVMTEASSTSSTRIFVKYLLQDMHHELGLAELKRRFETPYVQGFVSGITVKRNFRDTQFAINYLTAIGLGGLTEGMREYLDGLSESESENENEKEDEKNDEDEQKEHNQGTGTAMKRKRSMSPVSRK